MEHQNKPRIAVVGAGAIGGITAAYLAKAGYDVHLVCKHEEIAQKANGTGLKISGVKGEEEIRVSSVCEIEQLEGMFSLCLIATKAYDMPEAAGKMLPHLTEDALVVSMQNGICTDALSAVVGEEKTVGCVIGWGATMHAPGVLEMTSEGEFIIGKLQKGHTAELAVLKQALTAVVPTVVTDDILSELYSKLIVNACITSLGAICGLHLGEMMKRKQARKIFLAIIAEAMQTADAMQLHVPPFGGKLDYYKLMRGQSALDNLRRHMMIRIVGIKYKRLKSSSLQSLERGRPTEIDYFNGYLADKAEQNGLKAPVNRRLWEMVKEIEQKKRRIEEKNLYDPVFQTL